jgi:hypothetical protein
MFFDNRGNNPGQWAMFSIYDHSDLWNIQKRYFKTPVSFLSFSPWHIQIGFCIGKRSFTINYHHYKPMWATKKKANGR